jgi:hypothetical protein
LANSCCYLVKIYFEVFCQNVKIKLCETISNNFTCCFVSVWNLVSRHCGKCVYLYVGAWGERRYSSYSFTTSAIDGDEWSASRPGRALTPGERTPGTHCTGRWVGPRAGLDTEAIGKILCPCWGSSHDRPVVQPVVRHYTA